MRFSIFICISFYVSMGASFHIPPSTHVKDELSMRKMKGAQLQSRSFYSSEYRPNHPSFKIIRHDIQMAPSSSTRLYCQLLGMNCATPTDFTFSFKGFCLRGGATDVHGHGWGIAFYEGRGLRMFHDPEAASESPIAELVSNYPLRTLNMMAHIRYATQGEVCLENVHPFQREMVNIYCFRHLRVICQFQYLFLMECFLRFFVSYLYFLVGDSMVSNRIQSSLF